MEWLEYLTGDAVFFAVVLGVIIGYLAVCIAGACAYFTIKRREQRDFHKRKR
jgi:hypothetical protein